MISLRGVREQFPHMPEDVFEQWIAPLVEIDGWPLGAEKSDNIFMGEPLSYWSNAKWLLIKRPFNRVCFAPRSQLLATDILLHAINGTQTDVAQVKNTVHRFRACTEFICRYPYFPKPVIGRFTPDGLELVDGHHRLASVLALSPIEGFILDAWIVHENS